MPTHESTVAIIGCGVAGIAAAVRLRMAGFNNFVMFDEASEIGGTWWHNRYPGAATDTPVHMYSYSFMGYRWTSSHASQQELHSYLMAVVERFGLRSHMVLACRIVEATWDERSQGYWLRAESGEVFKAQAVISAVGLLNVPRYPEWPGLDSFNGPAFHTARWEDSHDLSGKKVAVVGTGSSAAQVVPELAKSAGTVYVFQREPGWVQRKEVRKFSERESNGYAGGIRRKFARARVFAGAEKELATGLYRADGRANVRLHARSEAFIREIFAGRPDLAEAMTPTYPYLCKRVVKSSDFYPALLEKNVVLVPGAVTEVRDGRIIDESGSSYEIDAIVLATGFRAEEYLSTVTVRGRREMTLREYWGGVPEAFLGIMVPEFPNFFMMYGPNTNGGALIFNFERQAEYIAAKLKHMDRKSLGAIEPRAYPSKIYNGWVQRALQRTTYASECRNYFRAETGRIVTQWPFTMGTYWALTAILGRVSVFDRQSRSVRRAASPEAVYGVLERSG